MATKNTRREALKILRQFDIAGQQSTTADISSCKESNPRATSRVLAVVYLKTQYFIVIDNTVDDDVSMAASILQLQYPQVQGQFIRNPHEDDFVTYGLRHKFRDTYLFAAVPVQVRLDKELLRRFPDLSRATIQKYIKAGYVLVDGEPVRKPSKDVHTVDDIALQLPPTQDFSDRELPIVYIDDDVIVVHKPTGMLTHSKGVMNDEFTVADFFRRYSTFGLATNRPGIVHRLDRDTSGLLIGARNDEAAALLKKQFADRTVKKQYLAVVDGQPKHAKAVVDVPLGRNPSAPSTFKVDPKGKAALTSYQVIDSNDQYSLVMLSPKTGRTHQLRVHMQYLGTPIVGDRVYGSTKTKTADRLYLHAQSLELTLPHGGHRQTFTVPAPDSFTKKVQ